MRSWIENIKEFISCVFSDTCTKYSRTVLDYELINMTALAGKLPICPVCGNSPWHPKFKQNHKPM